MANQYKNKVVFNGTTLIDLSDTTAVQSDVASGKVFYTASGEKVEGTNSGGGGTVTWETIADQTRAITTYDGMRYVTINGYNEPLSADETYRITWGENQYICNTIVDPVGFTQDGYYLGNARIFGSQYEDTGEPFVLYRTSSTKMTGATNDTASSVYVKIERQTTSSATLITKTVTANGTYNASDDNADGYSSVIVNVSGGSTEEWDTLYDGSSTIRTDSTGTNYLTFSSTDTMNVGDIYKVTWRGVSTILAAKSTTVAGGTHTIIGNPGVEADGTDDGSGLTYYGYKYKSSTFAFGTTDETGTISLKVEKLISGSVTPSETLKITENGIYDVTNYTKANVNIPTGGDTGMNVQAYTGMDYSAETSYTATDVTLTVAKTGTYNISWMGFRNTNSGTSGSQLYINGSAYGSAQTTFTSSYGQNVTLTGVSLTEGDVLIVRARARSTSYRMYVGNLIIEQTA